MFNIMLLVWIYFNSRKRALFLCVSGHVHVQCTVRWLGCCAGGWWLAAGGWWFSAILSLSHDAIATSLHLQFDLELFEQIVYRLAFVPETVAPSPSRIDK